MIIRASTDSSLIFADHIGTMKEDIKSAKDTVNTNLREARMEWMVNITHQQVEDSWSDLKKSGKTFFSLLAFKADGNSL